MTTTGILESFVEMTPDAPKRTFRLAFLSSLTPRAPRRLTICSRSSEAFSPMPPAMTIASAPPTSVL